VDNEPSELRGIEVVKMYYDAFKHFTTLNLATAVGIVTVNKLINLSASAFFPVLGLLSLSIYFALRGLIGSMVVMSEEDLSDTTFTDLQGRILICAVFFCYGSFERRGSGSAGASIPVGRAVIWSRLFRGMVYPPTERGSKSQPLVTGSCALRYWP